jgi:hypothetical protein
LADDQTRRQMLAMMLAGAAPAAAAADDSDEGPDTDAAPVPTAPGTPYQPLVNRPAPKGYSPPYGPPPWSGSPNPMALALVGGNGPPAGAAPNVLPPSPSAPSSPPQDRGFLASLLAGTPPSTGSRYNAQTGEFLPEAANAQSNAAPPPAASAAVGTANQSPANQIAGQVSDIGGQNPEQQEIFRARQELRSKEAALTAQINGTSNIELAKVLAAQRQALAGYDQQLESAYLGTLKPKGHVLSEDERTANRLPSGVYNESAEGAVSPVGGTQEEKEPEQERLWKASNEDAASRGIPQQSFHDFLLQKTAGAQAQNAIVGRDGQPVDDTLSGDALYAAVPGPVARMAKGMADGSVKIPNLTVRTDPVAKQAFLVAQAADPSLLDVNKVSARHEIEAGYSRATPGSLGGQVNAGNTAADHLADVVEAANDLKNTSGAGVPLVAHIANNLRNNITTGQAGKAGALEDGLLHYGEEIAKFYAGAQTGETERLRFLSSLGAAKSPEEMAGVFRMEARQLGGKFITLDDQVKQVMGPAAGKYPVVRSTTKENARRVTEGLAGLDPAGQEAQGARSPTDIWPTVGPTAQQHAAAPAAASSQQGPPPGFIKGGFRFKGGDPSQKSSWEAAQ